MLDRVPQRRTRTNQAARLSLAPGWRTCLESIGR